ncbi:MAG: TolC family protein [Pseudomonadota bacterium]
MRQRLLVWTAACCALLTLCSGNAAPDAAGLTLDEALARVLERNPTLQAAGLASRAAAARIRQAAQPNPWRAGLELENFAGNGATRGIAALETTLSLSRVLQTGAQPRLRGELARQEAALLDTEQEGQRLDLLADGAQRFIAVAATQARVQIAAAARDAAALTLAAVERRVHAGKSADAERATAAIALARAELDLAGVDSEFESARQALATTWGETAPDFDRVAADLYDLPAVAPYATLETWLAHNPDLARYATTARINAARAQLARAARRPDVELAAGVRHLSEPNDTALVLSASLPLGAARRAGPAIDEAEAQTLREPLLAEERRLALHSTLFALHRQLAHGRAAVAILRERIIPAATRALDDYRRGYDAGRYAWLELVNAQDTLRDAQRELLDTAASWHRTRIELDRLTGGRLLTGDAS